MAPQPEEPLSDVSTSYPRRHRAPDRRPRESRREPRNPSHYRRDKTLYAASSGIHRRKKELPRTTRAPSEKPARHNSKSKHSPSPGGARQSRRRNAEHQHQSVRKDPRRKSGRRHPDTVKSSSPFHAGLRNILEGLLRHGTEGPSIEELHGLSDEFGNLIIGALVDRLVNELKDGLLEKMLIEYLEELVKAEDWQTHARRNKARKLKGLKDLLKKAAMMMSQRFAQKS